MSAGEDPLVQLLNETLDRHTDPRVVVFVTHALVELMVNTLIENKCKHGKKITSDSRGFSHAAKLVILNELGIVDDISYQVLDRLRKLRNDAAHDPFFEVQESRIRSIAEPIEGHAPDIPEGWTRVSDDLGLLCANIVQSFWGRHKDVLGPVFAPNLYEALKGQRGKLNGPGGTP